MRKLILLPVLAFAAPALAQDVPGQAGEVANAIAACKAITEVDRIHPDRLPAAGWELARRRGARSGVVVHGVYEAESDRVRIVVATEQERDKSCVVQAYLESTGEYGTLLQAVSQEIGMPERQDGYSYFWNDADKAVRVDPAGDAKRPFARFEITSLPQESAE